jgi:thiamine-phosphate pyrophosphorylase
MNRRQSVPRQWLVADHRLGEGLWHVLERAPRGSGVLVLYRDLPKGERARLVARIREVARRRGLKVADEAVGQAARVHNMREVRRAAAGRVPLLFLSPLFPTRSHPEWRPLPRLRAARMARLARVPVMALGGMDAAKFRRVRHLGFHGWAGIDAWAGGFKFPKVTR